MRMWWKMQHIVWLMLLVLVFAACTHSAKAPEPVEGPNEELSVIDSLMWHQPDSAFALLLEFAASPQADSLDVFNGHYCQMLISELLYKNDCEQSNRPDLLQTVTYFDSLLVLADTRRASAQNTTATIAFLDARAHYINGVGYYENDSMVQACKEYMKALDVMENYFAEKELVGKKANFMALTYTRLTVLYSDHYLHDPAIYFGKNSLHYYEKSDDFSWHLAWMLDEIGLHYDMLEATDSATSYYERGLNLLPDPDNLTYRDISTHLAFLSYKKGESLESSLIVMHHIIDMANSDKEYYSRCLTIGEIFYHAAQFDSAWPYYNKVFHYTQSEDSKKLAAERLTEISKVIGCGSNSTEYSSYLAQFATISERQSVLNSTLVEIYRQYGQDKEAHLHTQNNRKKTKQATWVMCSLIVLTGLSIVINIIIRSRNKRLKKEKQKTEELLETENYSHKIKQAALSSKLKKSNEALRYTLKQLNNTTDKESFSLSSHTKDYTSYMETPICQHILETVHNEGFKSKMDCVIYKEHALQKEQRLALRLAADEKMDNFTVRIKKQFPSLTNDDVTYCCLYLLGLNEADISALMQKAYPTVCERKRKIKRIVGEEKDLPFVLRNLP